MSPEKLFDERMIALETEIRNLKTAHLKTATTISTKTANQALNFSLYLPDEYSILSTQRAVITMTSKNNTDMISSCYLVSVTPSNLNDRFVFIKRVQSPTGTAKFDVVVFSQNQDDYDTLSGGGSVNLNYTVQLVGSSDYNVSVEYRALKGGSS